MKQIHRPEHTDKSRTHWQTRPKKNWQKFQYNQPYAKGLANVKKVLSETNFDPATLWQWGTMQAMALIEVLKTAEKTFGAQGQKLVLDALKKIGHDIGTQILAGTTIDAETDTNEWISFYATVINRIAYASLESPKVHGENIGPGAGGSWVGAAMEGRIVADFHIDYCPHQDMYGAMDCRVQRYFVQGMIDAAREFAKAHGRDDIYDVMFKTTIPNGYDTCFFKIEKGDAASAERWARYTEVLEKKNLKLANINQGKPI
ncbi:MAG: hypothetical protein U1F27_07610 [Turneriella sp.]